MIKLLKWETCSRGFLGRFCIPHKTKREAMRYKRKLEKEEKLQSEVAGKKVGLYKFVRIRRIREHG